MVVELRGRVLKADVGAGAVGLAGRKNVDAMFNVTGQEMKRLLGVPYKSTGRLGRGF